MTEQPYIPPHGPNQAAPPSREIYAQMGEANIFNPAMRARHMPFAIDEAARQIWLDCFETVLAEAVTQYNFPAEHLPGFRNFLHGFSGWMVNTA